MPLYTKSIQAPKKPSDGIRICVMRRPAADADWDIWMPTLAPSSQLLTDYHANKVTWEEYCIQFEKEVLQDQREYVKLLTEMAKKFTITILCWEETPEMCHRRLVAEECKKIDSTLKVVVK